MRAGTCGPSLPARRRAEGAFHALGHAALPGTLAGTVTASTAMGEQRLGGVDVVYKAARSMPDALCRDPSCTGATRSTGCPSEGIC